MEVELSALDEDDYLDNSKKWKMSERESSIKLSAVFGVRLLTSEIQEMLVPMLGAYKMFSSGAAVNDVVDPLIREAGLLRIISRFSELLCEAIKGKLLNSMNNEAVIYNPLENYANFCAGLVLLGSASARELNSINKEKKTYFELNFFENSFSRLMSILNAGGIILDSQLSERFFKGASAKVKTDKFSVDISTPIIFEHLQGYRNSAQEDFSSLIQMMCDQLLEISLRNFLGSNNLLLRTKSFHDFRLTKSKYSHEFLRTSVSNGYLDHRTLRYVEQTYKAIDMLQSHEFNHHGIEESKHIIQTLLHQTNRTRSHNLLFMLHEIENILSTISKT